MIMRDSNSFSGESRSAENKRPCPECGGPMKEVDRRSENETLYVWLDCNQNNCDGQWLQKTQHKELTLSSGGPQG